LMRIKMMIYPLFWHIIVMKKRARSNGI
ncbi:hypothetical protein, partial [uncultured Gammaproteobacteria bacterium]